MHGLLHSFSSAAFPAGAAEAHASSPATIFTAEWGSPGCYFSGIERNLPDTKVYLGKKHDSYYAARASELPWSSAKVTFAGAPSCLVLLLSQQCA